MLEIILWEQIIYDICSMQGNEELQKQLTDEEINYIGEQKTDEQINDYKDKLKCITLNFEKY